MSSKRPSSIPSSSTPAKKTRFASPDPFAANVDAALELPSRRGRVRNEGYDSDSTDDGEGVVLSRRKQDADDDDMFATTPASPPKKKKDTFLRLADIDGQEFHSDSDSKSHHSADSDPDSDSDHPSDASVPSDDPDAAAARATDGMGFELSAFNMRAEMEDGKFAPDGSFIRTHDPHAAHDRWLDGTDARAMRRARKAQRARTRAEKHRRRTEVRDAQHAADANAMILEALALLKRDESTLDALARLGAQLKSAKQKATPTDTLTAQITRLTTLASSLMAAGDTDFYSKPHALLARTLRTARALPDTWSPPSADPLFEYRWAPHPDAPVFGPFPEHDMRAWHAALYFGPNADRVQVRPVGGDWGPWPDTLA